MASDDFDSGAYPLSLQAAQVAKAQTIYRGSSPCPACGIIVNPVEFMYNKGLCNPCRDDGAARRVKGRMA